MQKARLALAQIVHYALNQVEKQVKMVKFTFLGYAFNVFFNENTIIDLLNRFFLTTFVLSFLRNTLHDSFF